MVVRDAEGARWSVRARRLRRGESSRPWAGPEEESLRRRLAGALAPHPLVVPDPLRGVAGGWRTPGDAADVAMHQVRAAFGGRRDAGSNLWAVAQLARLLRDAVNHLRTPWSDTWQVEAAARGRIRRWVHWEVEGSEATEQAVTSVVAALQAGHLPQPCRAVLVEVVDQRPPARGRRSSGLGQRSPVG